MYKLINDIKKSR